MNLAKRACLYLVRKKGKTVTLLAFLLVMATLMLTCLSIQSATETANANIKKALMGYFTINAKQLQTGITEDIQIAQDTTKTKSSMRTLPLVPAFKEKLLKLKEQQEEYKRVCGRCYNKKYLEYICVDEMGTLISPHYLTSSFPKLLEKNNLRHIRFHDLRHSCASLLLANGVPMKQIQEWLGHSDFSTTANVYAHLDYNSKLSSADAMVNGLSGALEAIS